MAQKKDWSNGFEGRYRRTSSPSASPIRTSRAGNSMNSNSPVHPLAHHSSTKCLNSYNNNYSALSPATMLSSSTMALSYPSNSSSGSSSLSSSLSSSSSKSKSGSYLKHSASSTSSSSSSSAGSSSAGPRQPIFNSNHVKPSIVDNENHVNNEAGWAGHARQTSTTVDFTSEALRALRSNKPTGYYQPPINRTLPSAVSTPALLQQATFGPQASSNQGSSSSIASVPLDTPPKTSPESSLRASLDSLHSARLPLVSRPRGAHEGLPRTVSSAEALSNESFGRCTSAVESELSRSTSVADSLCRRSSSVVETPSSLSRTSSISESLAPSPTSLAPIAAGIDGAVIARPATVTEESGIYSSANEHSTVDESVSHVCNDREDFNSPRNSLVKCTSSIGDSPVPSYNSASSSPLPTPINAPASPVELQGGERNPTHTSISICASQSSSPLPPTNEPPLIPTSQSNLEQNPVVRMRVDTVTIGYGRGRRPEEVECDQLSMEYVSRLGLDPRLQALLGEYFVE
ncbi:hypothetical protein FHG87_007130 [Trinorchestia longiramus]|nr:hypothetical protein FHG87_007130 [Trinorchestia longiramus]